VLDAGAFQIGDGVHDLRISHVTLRIIVLIDDEDACVRRARRVEFGEVPRVLGQQDELVLGGVP